MYIKYFATNRDRENLGRDINRDTRIDLQKGGYHWIDTEKCMSHYLATTDPTTVPSEAIIHEPEAKHDSQVKHDSQAIIFDNFLNHSSIKNVIICIHGFNVHHHSAVTSFSVLIDTLKKSTELGKTLITDPTTAEAKFCMSTLNNLTAVVGFSWPSNGKVLDYGSDRKEAVSSASRLANLISKISVQNPNTKIHIIAHSMGNFLACTMLEKLIYEEITPQYMNDQIKKKLERRDLDGIEKKKGVFFVDCFIMLAPDVERRHVTQCDKHDCDKTDYLGPFHAGLKHLVGGVYLFYSKHDSALKASKIEKEVRERFGGIRKPFSEPDLSNLWEDSLGLNPAPQLAPPNMYSYNASTLSNRPIDHGDYFDTVAIAKKISESILNYK